MKRFKDILLAIEHIEDSEMILNRTVMLAKTNKANITIISVFEDIPNLYQHSLKDKYQLDTEKAITENAKKEIKELIEKVDTQGLKINTSIKFGTPYLAITEKVIRDNYDLVILTGTQQGSIKKTIFGSTTMALLRKCPCPIWVMNPPAKNETFGDIVVAIDDKHDSEDVANINTTNMELAISLAKSEDSKLYILQTWRHFGEELQRGHWGLPAAEVDQIDKDIRDEHKAKLDSFLKKFDMKDIDYEVELVKGDASSIITQFIDVKNIQLLVMGTVCRTGVAGFFMGNTAEKILKKVTCSVMTVKPASFESPIKIS